MTLGIVVPAYAPDVSRFHSYVEELRSTVAPDRIHVELDAPSSAAVPDRIRATGATVAVAPSRRGKGAAIAAGFDRLDTDRLAFVDVDGSTSADSVAAVVDGLDRGDLAVGTRRHPDATIVTNQSTVRKTLGDAFAWAARRVLEPTLSDYQCGAKAIDREAWLAVRDHIEATGFAWDLELVAFAHALNYDVVEVPVDWADHPESTVDPLATALELGTTLFSVRYRTARLRHLDRAAVGEELTAGEGDGDTPLPDDQPR